ncbi:MAG: type 1 glutamine amidotransferase [Terriglobia bacterium]
MKRVVAIQHVECETPGLIEEALASKGFSVEHILSFRGQPAPKELGPAHGLVLMGGPMGVYESERFPFLQDEMRLVEKTLRDGKPVLGVCLGSQLLAAALGSKVRKGARKEIGWHPITLTEAGCDDPMLKEVGRVFVAYHWHGDVFDVPDRATNLAASVCTECQGFRYQGNAYGLLFHMEITPEILKGMVHTFREELDQEGLSGDEILNQAIQHLPELQAVGRLVFDQWAALLHGAQP